jgi:hypothetical protein
MLNIFDEYKREPSAMQTDRRLRLISVTEVQPNLFVMPSIPKFMLSDKEEEFISQAVQELIRAVGAKRAYIAPESV